MKKTILLVFIHGFKVRGHEIVPLLRSLGNFQRAQRAPAAWTSRSDELHNHNHPANISSRAMTTPLAHSQTM
jgi:hypothetical protein